MLTLDAVIIGTSGGVVLASKAHWVRRVWAIAEVARGVSNIGVTTGTISNQKLQEASHQFNLALGLIGLKNVGKGLVSFTKGLDAQTRLLLKSNGNIRAVVLARYLDWKVAISKLDNLSQAERELLTKQDQVWQSLGVADKTADGKHLAWEEAVKIAKEKKEEELFNLIIKWIKNPIKVIDDKLLSKAKLWQGKGNYPGVDDWIVYEIPAGTKLYGGLPGQSEFYSLENALVNSNYSKASFWQSLQVAPHKTYGYREKVGEYVLTKPCRVAISKTLANPQHGNGGAIQVFVDDFTGNLKLENEIILK
ncbi:MAG: hypothetical protein RL662_1126 [Bacteroidota bacterium]